jgi:hypothetical protein
MAHSVTQYTDFIKAFFTCKMSYGFTVRAYFHLPAYEKHGLTWADFHEAHKKRTTALCAVLRIISLTSETRY